jgi:2-amino-4-hydroxy-6-hydroxymethyldihydropteridine diphosphokinase
MATATILIALGSNLRHVSYGRPRAVVQAAITELEDSGIEVIAVSRAYRTVPVGPPQPAYINACLAGVTSLSPDAVLHLLHAIERKFGRLRRRRWGPRVLDLDLIGWDDLIQPSRHVWHRHQRLPAGGGLALPHPRAHQRPFVLIPLAQVAGRWRHPVLGCTAAELAHRTGGRRQVHPDARLYFSRPRR